MYSVNVRKQTRMPYTKDMNIIIFVGKEGR